jgi:hypothetical protein
MYCTCVCDPVPVHSSRQEGCQLIDGIDDDGNRWHGFQPYHTILNDNDEQQMVLDEPCMITIVNMSQVIKDRIDAENAIVQAARKAARLKLNRRNELKNKMKTEQLPPEELQELLQLVLDKI